MVARQPILPDLLENMLPEVTRRGEHESGVRYTPLRMVATQPIHLDFFARDFRRDNLMQETCIWRSNNSKTHRSTGNQWKSSSRKHVFLGYLDIGNMNPGSTHLEDVSVDREQMEIEFTAELFHILNRKNNWSLVPTFPAGGGAVWRRRHKHKKSSREWRPRRPPTNG